MDKINVNAMSGKDYNLIETEQGSKASLQKGDIVNGIITDVSDVISIAFNDKEVKVPQSAVQNAKEGQIRQFEIKDISNKSIVLREVGTNTEGKSSGVLQTNVYNGGKAFSGSIQDKSYEEVESKKETVLSQMEKVKTSLTVEDYVSLKELDKSPEENSSEEFEKNLDRIKKQRQFTEEHIKKQIDKLDNKRELIEKASISSVNNAEEITKRLEKANLPVTKANIERVSTALEMVSHTPKLTSEDKAYLIGNEKEVTPENIYKASYTGSKFNNIPSTVVITEEEWEELKPKVTELLQKEGIKADTESLDSAKWLLGEDLPITGENIEKLSLLNSLQGSYNEKEVLDLIIQGMKDNTYPEKANLIQAEQSLENTKKTIRTMDLLQQLTDEVAERVEPDEMISLNTISQYQNASVETDGKNSLEVKNITARRQLEELRLKLTMESCYRLYQQGIEVDKEGLENVINQLKSMEESYYHQFYEAADVVPDELKTNLLAATDQVVSQLKTMPDTILAATFSIRRSITLMGLYETGRSTKSNLVATGQKAKLDNYETLMTSPRKDLGDSIKKAFSNVDSILKDLNMELSESNRQAVRILGYNSIDITKENITQMKEYQLQVKSVISSLTPEVTVSLIQEGDNPLQVSLSELNEKLEAIQKSLDTTSEEKFSEYLYKLDQKKSLSTEEREAYIGVYRLLYQVEKSDGAAVGAVVKANQELTLGNLLTAIRSKKKEGMDIIADEEFGGLDTTTTETSITQQINKVYMGRQITHEVYQKLEPAIIDQVYQSEVMDSYMDLGIEQLYDASTNSTDQVNFQFNELKYQQMLENYGRTKEATILVQNGQKVSANQLEAASILMTEGSPLYKEIKEQARKLDTDLAKSIQSTYEGVMDRLAEGTVEESFQSLTSQLHQMFEKAMDTENVTVDQIEQIRKYQNCIRLAGSLRNHQTFELPVVVGEDILNLKVKLVEGNHETSSVKIQMSGEQYGTMDAVATVKGDILEGYFVCNNRQVMDQLVSKETDIRQEIEDLGFKIDQFTITMNRKKKEFYQSDSVEKIVENKPSTQKLYQLAKIFVTCGKQATNQ